MGAISDKHTNRSATWPSLILLAVVLLVFGRTLTNDFVNWDDRGLIYANPNIADPTLQGLMHQWNPKNPSNSEMYDPLVYTLWWTLAHVAQLQTPDFLQSKLNPYVFHAASLAAHWLAACVVLEILRRLQISNWAALAGAVIFAIHPIQTEAVAWATAMKDLLSGLLGFLAIWRYLVALQSPPGDRRRRRNLLLATICFVGALLSKPSTVVVPLIAAAIDRMMLHRSWRDIGKSLWPWLALAAGCAAMTVEFQPLHAVYGGPFWTRPLIAMDCLAFYLYKIFLPIRLSFDYGRSPTEVLTNPSLHHPLYWTWIFPLAAAVIIWRVRRPKLTLAGLIFVLGLLPVLGLKTFVFQYYTTVADRYVYVSMLGVALAVGWVMDHYGSISALVVFCVVAVALGSLSFVQAGRWRDTETLYDYGLGLNKTRGLHYLIFGDYKDHLAAFDFKQSEQAGEQPKEARELARQGYETYEQAAALYAKAIELEPTNTNGYDRLARDLVKLNRIPQAIDVIKRWMAVEPRIDPSLREKPGTLQAMLGSLYLKNRQYPEAVAELRKAVQLDPQNRQMLEAAEKMLSRSTSGPSGPH
jgi:protein O-mannosyl-transferase